MILNLKKCLIFADSEKHLGYIIKPGVLAIKKASVKSLNQLKCAWNITKLRSSFELYNLHQRFFPNYTDIASLLTKFLQERRPKSLPTLNDHQSQVFDKRIQTISS